MVLSHLYQPNRTSIELFIKDYGSEYLDNLYKLNKRYFDNIGITDLNNWLYLNGKIVNMLNAKEDKNFNIVFDILQALIK